ncbi:hypothetical protein BW721_00245 [Jeotgalibaca sp. PTS2502]|uniref:histidinol-phosphatase HisJ family protein n=1 Tax=Jeotgalibaca sp. PTS2502 TaxID=1903686 RepID=UPI0009735216|nr:histidinol-phosphatase HisJ family protein [Jeotgalibaca sp. PTS2502]APZ48243.1 hypothetical protein BW721_00245 [Jeotgalibaca sp. PTS2502]
MTYYDQHMHTHFSPDSSETFEAYLALTDGIIVTTEHLDFKDAYNGGQDTILDYQSYSEKIAHLNDSYKDRIRRGIEVGYTRQSASDIQAYLKDKAFDVVLLSVHQNGQFDFLMAEVEKLNPTDVMKEYFELCLEAVQQFDGANVFAHFDYGLRRLDVSVDDLIAFKPILKELLSTLVVKEMALELNTRSMYDYGNIDLYRYMIQLYLSVGGRRFSLGSDAHSTAKYRYRFDDAIQLLKEMNVHEVVQFKQQQAYVVAI